MQNPSMAKASSAYDAAIRLLARREHGSRELADKLKHKGYLSSDIEQALTQCQDLGYLCDRRFASAYLRYRAAQGFGASRIKQELLMKRIDADVVETAISEEDIDWSAIALAQWKKKAGAVLREDENAKQKIKRFMFYRGFDAGLIQDIETQV